MTLFHLNNLLAVIGGVALWAILLFVVVVVIQGRTADAFSESMA